MAKAKSHPSLLFRILSHPLGVARRQPSFGSALRCPSALCSLQALYMQPPGRRLIAKRKRPGASLAAESDEFVSSMRFLRHVFIAQTKYHRLILSLSILI